jgi:hypothetical protein
MRALPEVREDRWRPYLQKLKIENVAPLSVFFILRFSGNHQDTPRAYALINKTTFCQSQIGATVPLKIFLRAEKQGENHLLNSRDCRAWQPGD